MKYKWEKQTTDVKERIQASHDSLQEWHPDPKGYFLIRVKEEYIEVGFVTPNHTITKVIYGTDATEIYSTIIREKLVTRLEHAPYLGKELEKAALALKYGLKYVQEAPLNLSK